MAAIDRPTLLADVKKYLGDANALDDATILELGEEVISEVGDDDEYYKEIRCKTLKAAATVNQALSTVELGRGVRKEESYERLVEWQNGSDIADYWGDYLDRLPRLCEALGYCGLTSNAGVGFFANVPTTIVVPDCGTTCDLTGFSCSDD